uniref:Uncharacterized protein n=1 Tax=Arundo donax TaxID=35708 RepID=A0A0A8Y3S5_ARUDO
MLGNWAMYPAVVRYQWPNGVGLGVQQHSIRVCLVAKG